MRPDSLIKKISLLIGLFLVFAADSFAAKDSPFLPLSEVRPGMKGTAYTVISGTKVDSFSVNVLGVLEGSGSVRHLILVQVSGRSLQGFGGIAAGMSGSPVFVRGKLMGAIGYGFQNADPRYGLVTPIEDMMKLLSADSSGGDQTLTWTSGGFRGFRGVALGRSVNKNWLSCRPVATPVCVAGLGERAFKHLSRFFPSEQVEMINLFGKGGQSVMNDPPLIPGSALGVQLVTGDYQVTAIGTLTWIEGNQFLAFGHPFLNKGNVDYYVTNAIIYRTVGSQVFPFKLGDAMSVVGRLRQDRGAGISGFLGQLPAEVPVRVKVAEEGGKSRAFEFRVVHDETLMKGLIISGALEAIDETLDRIGPGTSEVHIRVKGDSFGTIDRTNLFYAQDIAAGSLKEAGKLLDLLFGNEFVNIRLTGVELELKIAPEHRTARVQEAGLRENRKYKPGETIQLDVTLLPYRGVKEKVQTSIALPDNLPPGKWLLSIHGGNYSNAIEEEKETDKKENDNAENWRKFGSLQEQIADFLSQPTNNMLVVEAFPLTGESGAEPQAQNREENPVNASNVNPYHWTSVTKYFLTGEAQVTVEVIPK